MRTKKFTKEEKELLRVIGTYFRENIDKLRILDVEFNKRENMFHILLSRPGLLIGKKGKDYYRLLAIANETIDTDEEFGFHIHESTIDQHLRMWEYIEEYVYNDNKNES